jgi:hypothetical protein
MACHDIFGGIQKSSIFHKFPTSYWLTPKGPRGVFLQKRSKSAISSSRRKNEFFFTFLHFQL